MKYQYFKKITKLLVNKNIFPFLLLMFLMAICQASFFLTFFLPLKIILIASANIIPSYIDAFKLFENIDQLLYFLLLITVLCYLAYRWLLKITQRLTMDCAVNVCEKNNKQYEDSDIQLLASAYEKTVATLLSCVFSILVSVVIYLINPSLFLLLLGLFSLLTPLLYYTAISYSKSRMTGVRVVSNAVRKELFTQTLNVTFILGFLLIFAFTYQQYVSNLLWSILLLIIVRQGSLRVIKAYQDICFLTVNANKLLCLIERERKIGGEFQSSTDDFLDEVTNKVNFESLLCELSPNLKLREVLWRDSGISNIIDYIVSYQSKGGDGKLLFRFYPRAKRLQFKKELQYIELIDETRLAFNHENESYNLLVLYLPASIEKTGLNKIERLSIVDSLYINIAATVLPKEFLQSYKATHNVLHDRLNSKKYNLLRYACNSSEEIELVESFYKAIPSIEDRLSSLPLCMRNKRLNTKNSFITELESIDIVGFDWALEPLGSNVPLARVDEFDFSMLIDKFHESHPNFSFSKGDVVLSAVVSSIESKVNKFEYREAIASIENYKSSIFTS